MLRVEDLRIGYGAIEVIHGLTLGVDRGQLVVLIGANGAGKTTLLRALSGLIFPRGGRVLWEGYDITLLPPHARVRQGLVLAPEGRRIFGPLSVWENLRLGGYLESSTHELRRRLELVLTLFPQLKDRLGQRAGTLSGGEQQMLAIGRALMAGPRLLMLDEPSMGLAPVLVQQIFRLVAEIRHQGVTLLLAEQNARQAVRLADYAYVLERGQVAFSGEGQALLGDPAVRATYLGIES